MELLSLVYYNTFMPNCSGVCVNKCTVQRRSSMKCRKRGGVQVAGVAARPVQVDLSASDTSKEGSIKWGWVGIQGARTEMEDAIVLRVDGLNNFTYAAVFDGHAGFASAKFLKDELYKECAIALQDGLLLESNDLGATREALRKAFIEADRKLISWLEEVNDGVDSGSTATVMFVGGDRLIISHIGDSSVVLSRSGKPMEITSAHRPYGNSKVSLDEIRRIKAAGGWVTNGRICGDISVSRAFGDMRFKTKMKDMLEEGIREGKWTGKFASRIKPNGDWVTATPDIYHADLGPDIEFIIVASDGLWDCMNSSDAVKFVRSQLRQHRDVQVSSSYQFLDLAIVQCACEALANAALKRNTQDNVSIIIADFGRVPQGDGPEEEQNFGSEIVQATATVGIVTLGIWLSSLVGQELGR